METNNCMNVRHSKKTYQMFYRITCLPLSPEWCRIRNEARQAFVYPACRGWNELETTHIHIAHFPHYKSLGTPSYDVYDIRKPKNPLAIQKLVIAISSKGNRIAYGCTVIFMQTDFFSHFLTSIKYI